MDALPDLPGRPCSIAAALTIIGDRWSLLAVREVSFGNHRFTEMLEGTGAPRDRLAARLKDLVAAGVLERRQYQDAPPRSDYHLTRAGRELVPVLRALMAWGDRWAVAEPPVTLLHHPSGGGPDHPLDPDTVCRTCGEHVYGRDVTRRANQPQALA